MVRPLSDKSIAPHDGSSQGEVNHMRGAHDQESGLSVKGPMHKIECQCSFGGTIETGCYLTVRRSSPNQMSVFKTDFNN